VTVRVRPDDNGLQVVRVDPEANQVLVKEEKQSLTGKLSTSEKPFTFDRVLGPDASQDDVYDAVGSKALDAVLKGCEACILAYGQTGSGKTHTLMHLGSHRGFAGDVAGAKEAKARAASAAAASAATKPSAEAPAPMPASPDSPSSQSRIIDDSGMLPRLATDLFVRARSDLSWRTEVRMSMVQIYSEQLVDLLQGADKPGSRRTSGAGDESRGRELKLVHRRDEAAPGAPGQPPKARWVPEGARWVTVKSADELIAKAAEGRKRIVYAETHLNKHSSRAHALLFVEVVRYGVPLDGNDETANSDGTVDVVTITGRLTVADLAGSERTKVAERGYGRDQYDRRFREATAINTSLLALGQVVAALADSQGSAAAPHSADGADTADGAVDAPTPRHHIPYRDSALTKLLEEPLSTGASVSLLACVSPLKSFAVESINTLDFAGRAMVIETRAQQRIGTAALSTALLQEAMTTTMENEALRRACEDLLETRKSLALAEQKMTHLEAEASVHASKLDAARASAAASTAALAGDYETKIVELEACLKSEKAMQETDKLRADTLAGESADRIAELEAEIARLRTELDAANERIAALEAEKEELGAEVGHSLEDREQMMAELQAEQARCDSLNEVIQSIQGEMKGVQFMLTMEQEKNADAAESAARAAEAAEELLQTQHQISELRVERVQALAQRQEHEFRLQMLNLELRLAEREGAEEALIEELRASRSIAEEECARFTAEMDTLADKLDAMQSQFMAEQQAWIEERSVLEGVLNESHVALATTAGALAECREESAKAYEAAISEGSAMDRMSALIERERHAREEAEAEVERMKASTKELVQSVETMKEAMDARSKEQEQSLASNGTLVASYQAMMRREDRMCKGFLVLKYPGKDGKPGQRPSQPRLVRAYCISRGDHHALPIGQGANSGGTWWVEWTHVGRDGASPHPPSSAKWRGAPFESADFDDSGVLTLSGSERKLRLAPDRSSNEKGSSDLKALAACFTAERQLTRLKSSPSTSRNNASPSGSPSGSPSRPANVQTPAEAADAVRDVLEGTKSLF